MTRPKPPAANTIDPATTTPRMTGPPRRPGTYIGCHNCGRLLNIQWATRSIVCACGTRLRPEPEPSKEKPA